MTELYPARSSRTTHGMLDVGDGNHVYWETCGNPAGKPALVLHGGPGSGAGPFWRRLFDPAAYRIVLLDQRGCGRSTPDAADPRTSLAANTTRAPDRRHRAAAASTSASTQWLVLGGSWGVTLALAYAEQHPGRVSELVLFSVTNTTRREVEWVTRDMGRIFPEEWARFRDAVPEPERDGSLVDAYARMLADPDPAVRERAAREWCRWEDVHVSTHPGTGPIPATRTRSSGCASPASSRTTGRHAAFLEDGALLRDAGKLAGIPGVMVHGRHGHQRPRGHRLAAGPGLARRGTRSRSATRATGSRETPHSMPFCRRRTASGRAEPPRAGSGDELVCRPHSLRGTGRRSPVVDGAVGESVVLRLTLGASGQHMGPCRDPTLARNPDSPLPGATPHHPTALGKGLRYSPDATSSALPPWSLIVPASPAVSGPSPNQDRQSSSNPVTVTGGRNRERQSVASMRNLREVREPPP